MNPRTLDELMRLPGSVQEKAAAFAALPEHEREQLFSFEEHFAFEAHDLYSAAAQRANAVVRELMDRPEAMAMIFALCRVQAANELRCEMAHVGRPTLEDTFAEGAPYALINRATIDRFKSQIRAETFPA